MTTNYKLRKDWTDSVAKGDTLTDRILKGVACHYPGSGNEVLAHLSESQVVSRLNGWRNYHVNVRGWVDIGYQVAIDGSGRVWDLRGIGRVPAAHASSLNPDANHEYGACLFIIGDNEVPTTAAIQAFNDWRDEKWLKKWPNAIGIIGHDDVPGASTGCPGKWLLTATRNGSLIHTDTDTNGADEVKATDIVGQDSDGTPLTMGELAARMNWVYDAFKDGGKIDTILDRIAETTKTAATKK